MLLSVSMKDEDLYKTVDSFVPDYVRQIIFTKLDETSTFGSILNVSMKTSKPISYMTTGQNVPDDIESAQAERLADLFFGAEC